MRHFFPLIHPVPDIWSSVRELCWAEKIASAWGAMVDCTLRFESKTPPQVRHTTARTCLSCQHPNSWAFTFW